MTRNRSRRKSPAEPASRGPAWLVAVAVAVALVGAGGLVLAARIGFAAWLVFPAQEVDPIFETAVGDRPDAIGRLERAASLAPGDGRYRYLLAEAERRRALRGWIRGEAGAALREAEAHARDAVDIGPRNPYPHLLLGGILLDQSRLEVDRERVREAIIELERARELSPGSPVVAQRVGMELIRVWGELDEAGRELAASSLLQAGAWHGALTRPAHEAIRAHLPPGEAIPLAGAITPPTAEGSTRLEGFLRDVARRVPRGSEERARIAGLVIDAGLDLLRRSGFPPAETLDWSLWASREFPEQRARFADLLQEVLDEHPDAPGPLLGLAAVSNDPGLRLELSARAVDVTEQGDPDVRWLALDRHGAVLEQEGRLEEALEVYERMADLAPEEAEPLQQAARVLESLGRRVEALTSLETAVSRDVVSLEARRALGDAYFERSLFGKAIDAWRHVVQRAPRDATTRLHLARAYEQLGRLDDAETYYEAAADIDPSLEAELLRFRARLVGIEQ